MPMNFYGRGRASSRVERIAQATWDFMRSGLNNIQREGRDGGPLAGRQSPPSLSDSPSRVILPLDVPFELVRVEIDLPEVACGVPACLVVEVR